VNAWARGAALCQALAHAWLAGPAEEEAEVAPLVGALGGLALRSERLTAQSTKMREQQAGRMQLVMHELVDKRPRAPARLDVRAKERLRSAFGAVIAAQRLQHPVTPGAGARMADAGRRVTAGQMEGLLVPRSRRRRRSIACDGGATMARLRSV
jgi:hypothetical protein